MSDFTGSALPADDGPWTAELVCEDEPDGIVVLKNKDGNPRVFLARRVFDWFRNGGAPE